MLMTKRSLPNTFSCGAQRLVQTRPQRMWSRAENELASTRATQ